MHIQRVGINMYCFNNMQKYKYLSLFILGFGFGFFTGNAQASDENGDAFCLAQNIYFESGNQPLAGKIAVAQVVQNRMNDFQFPDTICDVVYQSYTRVNWKGNVVPQRGRCQFSWYCDGKSDEPVDSVTWIESMGIARRVLAGEWGDITEGGLYYHADYIYPYWASSLNETVIINNHIFYK
jgi:N-acetylmuramoyl-L-alanine amidase